MDDLPTLLSPAAHRLWKDYVDNDLERPRKASLGVLRRFLSAIRQNDPDNRQCLTLAMCRAVVDEGHNLPVRLPLLEDLIVPELVRAHADGHPDAARYLSSFHEHLLKSETLMTCLSSAGLTQVDLLKMAVREHPGDLHLGEQLLSLLDQWFDWCVMEAPDLVRYGSRPATAGQKNELLRDLDLFETVMAATDNQERFSEDVTRWRSLVSQWEPQDS